LFKFLLLREFFNKEEMRKVHIGFESFGPWMESIVCVIYQKALHMTANSSMIMLCLIWFDLNRILSAPLRKTTLKEFKVHIDNGSPYNSKSRECFERIDTVRVYIPFLTSIKSQLIFPLWVFEIKTPMAYYEDRGWAHFDYMSHIRRNCQRNVSGHVRLLGQKT
jgi:hypothetical protein